MIATGQHFAGGANHEGGAQGAPVEPDAVFWSMSDDALLAALESSRNGLSIEDAWRRLARYGPNRLTEARTHPNLSLLRAQVRSPISLLLAAAATLSLVVGETVDGAIVHGILVVSGLLGFWQERRAAPGARACRVVRLAMART